MTWYAVHSTDGELVSITTLLPEDLPPELAFAELGADKPDWTEFAWDPTKLSMAAKPPPEPEKDKVDDLLAAVPALTTKLTAMELDQLKVEAGKLLGDDRYYSEVAEVVK